MYEPAGRQYRYCPGCADKRHQKAIIKIREGQERYRAKVRLEKLEREKQNEKSI